MSDVLMVRRGSAVVPFSRGILARSLLKLGLDATRAYDIASRLSDDLQAEGVTLVTSQHLARILSERLGRYAGLDLCQRYEKLRLFKRSTRPLVLLIGGSTGSGKSTLASEVAHRLDITRILSTDSVRHVMRAMISERLLPSIHRSSFEAWDEAALVPDAGGDATLRAFLEQVRHVAVAVEAVLERAALENLSTILEGVHLVPGLFRRLAADPRLHFLHLVVHVQGEGEHRQRFLARGRGAAARPGKRYLDHFDAIRSIQGFLVERAAASHVPCVENSDFDAAVHATLGLVLDGVGDSSPIVPARR